MKLSEEKAISNRSIHCSPSVFTGIAKSIISTPQPPPRPTKKASSQFRNLFPDELKQFELKDRVEFTKLKEYQFSEHNLVILKMAH